MPILNGEDGSFSLGNEEGGGKTRGMGLFTTRVYLSRIECMVNQCYKTMFI